MEVAPTDLVVTEIIKAMANDLDSPRALAALQKWIIATNEGGTGGSAGELGRAIDALLGIAL
jgi:L-cysteine:1D-myo-inositol 2-amino-2-deoxy-alpha-D-glucopyranoside ligase